MTGTMNIGRKISRIRELRGIKQEVLAEKLGMNQATISRIESSDTIAEDVLLKISQVLGVSPEAIKNFSEEALIFHIEHMHDQASASYNFQCTYNPLDKVIELYERLLASEREKTLLFRQQQQNDQ